MKWSPPFGDGDGCARRCAPAGSGRFNGTTAFRRWRSHGPTGGYQRRRPASMGPPPFGDGNVEGSRRSVGAVMPLQWGHRLSAMETSRWLTDITISVAGSLQWGHRLSAMETASRYLRSPYYSTLQWGHRLSAMETRTEDNPISACRCSSGFNGATAFRRWKPRRAAVPGAVRRGFNGATAFRRWKRSCLTRKSGLQWGHRLSAMETELVIVEGSTIFALQWGHRLSAMETSGARRNRGRLVVASMGPPPFGDGNGSSAGGKPTMLASPVSSDNNASMGPPPFGDGNSRWSP